MGIISGIDLEVLFLNVKFTPSDFAIGEACFGFASAENETV